MTFIVIDGLDAAGKSTQAVMLSAFLTRSGKTVYTRFHPSTDNPFGDKAKQFLYLRGKNAHFAAALFYMLDVIRSIILYSWRRYDYIIFVRYLMGTAYLPPPLHKIAYHFFAFTVPTSEYMFFLDVTPKEAHNRIIQTRERLEMFETLEDLKRIRSRALTLASMGRWTIVDANRSAEEIGADLRTAL